MSFVKIKATPSNAQGSIHAQSHERTFYLNSSHIAGISEDGWIKLAGSGSILHLGGEYFIKMRLADIHAVKIEEL